MKTGDYVQCFFDARDRAGYQACYGIVYAAGPKSFSVRWESGIRQRRPQGDREVILATNQELAIEAMAKADKWRNS